MPTLPVRWIEHLGLGLSLRVAACDADGEPRVCRGLATRVLADGRVELLLSTALGADVLEAIGQTGLVSMSGSLPGTHRTLHLKGQGATILPADTEHQALLTRSRNGLIASLAEFGFDGAHIARHWFALEPDELRCVRFWISGAWDQTPGPGAGQPVELLP